MPNLSDKPEIFNALSKYRDAINDELDSFFKTDFEKFLDSDISEFGQKALKMLHQFDARPSKRIRGSLTCLVYKAAGGKNAKHALTIAAAMELLQDDLLMIDDVMDLSNNRRGEPTIHELYKKYGFEDHTAKMMAIDLGLITQHLLNILILNLKIDNQVKSNILKLLHRNVSLTGFGQLDDLYQAAVKGVTKSEILRMYRLKSGYYTFVNPIHMGLALAGVDNKAWFKESENFGTNAGIAFQLRDDVLGLFGDPTKTGKSVTDDIKEGKYTMLIERCLKLANKKDAKFVASQLGNHRLTTNDFENIKQIIINCGARSQVEAEISKYAKTAKNIISKSTFWDQNSKNLLISLVEYSAEREK